MIVELKDREQATVRAHKNHQLINQPANRIRPPLPPLFSHSFYVRATFEIKISRGQISPTIVVPARREHGNSRTP